MQKEKSQDIVSNFIWRFLEKFGGQIVTFIVSIVLARILNPEVYGMIALVTVITTILQVFVDSGLGNALIQKKNADDLDFSTVFYFNIVFCLALYGLLFLCAPLIAKFYKLSELTPVIRVLGLSIVISGVKNVQQAYISKHMLFRKFFFSTLGGTIGAAIVGISFAVLGFGVWALVAQNLFNIAVATIVLWITVKWRPIKKFSFYRLKGLFSYGWKLLGAALLDTVYNNIRQLIIGKKYSTEDLSFYNRGKQFPQLIVDNVNSSIDSVLLPVLSEEQDNKSRVRTMTRRAIKTSSYIMWPCMIGLAICAEPLVRLVLTEKWLPCVPFLQIFCFTYAFYPIHTANLNAMKALGRSDLFLVLEIIKKVIGFAAIFISMWFGVMAMAYSLLITTVLSSIINAWPNRKLLRYSYLEQIKDMLPAILLAGGMGTIVYCVNFLNLNNLLTLVIQIPLGIATYVIGSIIFKLESFYYLLNIIKGLLSTKKEKEETKMKKVLILGGSKYVLPVIDAIHKLGYYAITCDYLPNNIAHKYSDEYHNISILEKDEILKLATELKIDGIMSFACDPGVETAAYVAQKLNLPSVGSYEAVSILQNKIKFREFLTKNGFNVPQSVGYFETKEAETDAEKFCFPIIIKPADSAGSKGVTRVDTVKDIRRAAEYAKSFSKTKMFIIEEFIEKDGYSSDTDSFSVNGELMFCSFNNQYFDNDAENPYTPAAYSWPSTMPAYIQELLRSELQRLISLLNLGTSIYNIETRLGKNGKPYIMEVSPRGGGNRLAEILRYASNTDLITNSVRAAVGEEIIGIEQDPIYFEKWAEIILHSKIEGIFERLEIDSEFEKKFVVEKDIWIQRGDFVHSFTDASHAIGTLILKFDSQERLEDYVSNIDNFYKIVLH